MMAMRPEPLGWLDIGYLIVGILASAVALYFLYLIVCAVL